MPAPIRPVVLWFLLAVTCAAGEPTLNLLTNGGFESGLGGWRPMWTRDSGAGTVALDRDKSHAGVASARIEHHGSNDWSFEPELRVAVRPGELFQWSAWLQVEGPGTVTVCASTWDARGQNLSWSEGERTVRTTKGWQLLRSRFVAGPGVAQVQPRIIGHGPVTAWLDDCALTRINDFAVIRGPGFPGTLVASNAALVLTLDTTNGSLSALDRRTGRLWSQKPGASGLVITEARAAQNQMLLGLAYVTAGLELRAKIELDPTQPEFTVELTGDGEMEAPLRFPYPFCSQAGDHLVVPMNEGISYPVDDQSIEPFRLIAYGGHGICMGFWGVTDDRQGYGAIFETADDASIRGLRIDNLLAIAPEWDTQKGRFGYGRRLRYVFFDKGGHVAIAKRYRKYAQETGLLKTLEEKRKENPAVDLLVGAVNVWNWDCEPVQLAKEMQAAGIERILWSRGGSPEALRALNDLKVLTSRYDIYQDVMDPANFPSLTWVHQDWTTAAWPRDIITRADGDWLRGWGVKGKKGEWYYCGVICDKRALDYSSLRIPAELATQPYKCRFIDTTTAAPWNECYNTNHPMTRTDGRIWKMKLLESISREHRLVTGSETGHDAAVPFVHYFEGMLSLGPYRVPDAGRDMQRIWDEVPENVAKFQLGHKYRLPLWELVYHDCVVAQWYWGDYNNKLPSLWKKRDLFNVLYGTPPMFMFNRKLWDAQKDRFVQSYQNICPTVRDVGYSEMTDHRFLTPDRGVQQTAFANGQRVTVNFEDKPFKLPSGAEVAPLGFLVEK